jgi:hypothetical protein
MQTSILADVNAGTALVKEKRKKGKKRKNGKTKKEKKERESDRQLAPASRRSLRHSSITIRRLE